MNETLCRCFSNKGKCIIPFGIGGLISADYYTNKLPEIVIILKAIIRITK